MWDRTTTHLQGRHHHAHEARQALCITITITRDMGCADNLATPLSCVGHTHSTAVCSVCNGITPHACHEISISTRTLMCHSCHQQRIPQKKGMTMSVSHGSLTASHRCDQTKMLVEYRSPGCHRLIDDLYIVHIDVYPKGFEKQNRVLGLHGCRVQGQDTE